MSGHPYLVVVAPAGEVPTANNLSLFIARPNQGVNYAKGVWHHPLLALGGVSDFLVIDRSGPGNNCDEVQLEERSIIQTL
jgi:ureidoglycolate lyase